MKRVLAVRLDNIGDVVMLTPALRSLRAEIGPAGHLALLSSPAGAGLVPLLPEVDDVIPWRAVWQDVRGELGLDPARELRLVDELRGRHFDAALIFTSWSQSPWAAAYVCLLAGIPVRAGESREFGGAVLTHLAEPLAHEVHQVERNLHLLTALGLPRGDDRLGLHVQDEHRRQVASLLAGAGLSAGEPYVVVAPGASCAARRYPPPRFARVVERLQAVLDLPVVVVGSEREGPLLAPVTNQPAAIDLVGATSLPVLAALLEAAVVAIVNDSGPMHVAAAVGTPVVALYSGTELESQWAPRHGAVAVLRRPTPCTPCHRFECPIGLPCLDIGADEVVEAAGRLLAVSAGSPR